MSVETQGSYEFGPFLLDPAQQQLFEDGRPIPLTPKAFDTLRVLVENHGRLVSKEELLQRVWPDAFVEEATLAQNVFRLRKVLGDGGTGTLYIETVPKRGYRFVAKVNGVQETPKDPEPKPEAKRGHSRARWAIVASGAAVLVVILAGFGWYRYLGRSAALTEDNTIVLADFANATGEAVFDTTLRQGLGIQLAQSPFLNIASKSRIQRALESMGESRDAPLSSNLAREVCQRTGSTIVLDGSISQVGSHYAVNLSADRCSSGRTVATTAAEAPDKNHVLNALGEAASQMRARLGEPGPTVQKYDTPIEQATTTSLEALQAYSLARRIIDSKGDYAAAVPMFQAATRLDPNFAIAYAGLGTSYFALEEPTQSEQSLRRAYSLRDRVSEHERFEIESLFHWFATGDLEKARQVYEQWARIYPRDDVPHNNLGVIYQQLGDHQKTLEEARQCFRLDPDSGLSYANLVDSYLHLNLLKEARAAAAEAQAKNLDSPHLHFYLYRIAFLENNADEMKRQVAWASGKPGAEELLFSSQAYAEMYLGHFRKARESTQHAVDASLRGDDKEAAAGYWTDLAESEADLGLPEAARQDVHSALALSSTRDVRIKAAHVLARTTAASEALKTADDLEHLYPQDTIISQIDVPTIRAAAEIYKNNPSRAIALLTRVSPYELGSEDYMTSTFLRGNAYLLLHQGHEAANEFQRVLDHRQSYQNSVRAPLAQLGLARAYVAQADAAKARSAYENLFSIWKDADPDLLALKQAKAEYARLGQRGVSHAE